MKRNNEADVAASMRSRFSDRDPGSRRPRKRQPPPPSQGKQRPQAVDVSPPPPKAKQSAKSTTGSGSGGTVPSGSRGDEQQRQQPQGAAATADAGVFTGRYHHVRRKTTDGGKNVEPMATSGDGKPSSPKRHIFLDFGANKLSDFKLSAGDIATPDAKVHSVERKTRSSTVESSGVAGELSPKPALSKKPVRMHTYGNLLYFVKFVSKSRTFRTIGCITILIFATLIGLWSLYIALLLNLYRNSSSESE